jgi:hypothetical protein
MKFFWGLECSGNDFFGIFLSSIFFSRQGQKEDVGKENVGKENVR